MAIAFYILFALLAFLYASVGHGGGSGYLAAMGLMGVDDPSVMRSTALFLNLFVSSVSFLFYQRYKHFDRRLFLYLVLGSIPMAFVGGSLELPAYWYHIIVAIFLVYSSLRLLGLAGKWSDELRDYVPWKTVLAGAVIGLVSGIIGIGGGILLSPLIIVFKWARAKTAAGIAALFIFVNSLSGIIGLNTAGQFSLHPQVVYWTGIVLVFGSIGAWMGSSVLSQKAIRYLLVGVLLLASVKMLLAI